MPVERTVQQNRTRPTRQPKRFITAVVCLSPRHQRHESPPVDNQLRSLPVVGDPDESNFHFAGDDLMSSVPARRIQNAMDTSFAVSTNLMKIVRRDRKCERRRIPQLRRFVSVVSMTILPDTQRQTIYAGVCGCPGEPWEPLLATVHARHRRHNLFNRDGWAGRTVVHRHIHRPEDCTFTPST